MKERPVIHVVINIYGDVVRAFYERSEAEAWCKTNGSGYTIQKVQCE